MNYSNDDFIMVAENTIKGNSKKLKQILNDDFFKFKSYFYYSAAYIAAENGCFSSLMTLYNFDFPMDVNVSYIAAKNKHWNCLVFIVETGHPCDFRAFKCIIENNRNYHFIRWAVDNLNVSKSNSVYINFAYNVRNFNAFSILCFSGFKIDKNFCYNCDEIDYKKIAYDCLYDYFEYDDETGFYY